jgi:hypothetical protein
MRQKYSHYEAQALQSKIFARSLLKHSKPSGIEPLIRNFLPHYRYELKITPECNYAIKNFKYQEFILLRLSIFYLNLMAVTLENNDKLNLNF